MVRNTTNISEPISSPLIYGLKRKIIFQLTMVHILWIAFSIYRNPLAAYKVLKRLMQKKRSVQGDFPILKYVRSDSRYYWALLAPGWPSKGFRAYIEYELNKLIPFRPENGYLQSIIFSVTNRCPLSCEHCFEWQNLDSTEYLSLQDLKKILDNFLQRGVVQIQFSGGEPLARFEDTIKLIKYAQGTADFWLLTSGYKLTLDKAEQLKAAGLSGVNISLDHWDEEKHNQFRHNQKSFYWVKQAAINSYKANLAVSMSLCAVKEFISEENLWKYVHLARDLGAGFVRILEPRKVGHFKDKDVELNPEHIEILNKFYIELNSKSVYGDFPIVVYPGYHQRAYGCFGAGNRYLFIDSNGDLHACPFCQHTTGNALTDPIDTAIKEMKRIGCHRFETVNK
jgi:MoaA/NifB/PqqE/SkfB family radical SAM enzyme